MRKNNKIQKFLKIDFERKMKYRYTQWKNFIAIFFIQKRKLNFRNTYTYKISCRLFLY